MSFSPKQDGLVCFERSENESIPGCEEVGDSGTNFCLERPENFLWTMGDEGKPEEVYPLGICEGDCDTNEDCAEGLECFQRSGLEEVPGCNGFGEKGKDYCYLPSKSEMVMEEETEISSVNITSGDNVPSTLIRCDTDSDCLADEPHCKVVPNDICSKPPCGYCN